MHCIVYEFFLTPEKTITVLLNSSLKSDSVNLLSFSGHYSRQQSMIYGCPL